ncbi:hypothetical protein ACLBWJ_13145 [Microbacterium sp. M4A5_1d]
MTSVIVVMYAVSAALPVAAVVHAFFRARAAASALKEITLNGAVGYGGVSPDLETLTREFLNRPRAALWDITLLGGGVIVGAAASILAVLFPAPS